VDGSLSAKLTPLLPPPPPPPPLVWSLLLIKLIWENFRLLHPVIHRRAPQRRWQTKKLVKFVIITHAPPYDAQATAGVTVDFADAAIGVTVLLDAVVPAEIPLVAALPPLWNAWWCGACTALHFVGDGGELIGPCLMCQVRNPVRNHVMLDPDEREGLRRMPGLSYQPPGVASGMSSPDDSSPQDSSSVGSGGGLGIGNLSFSGEEDDDDFEGEKTDQEVSKYGFHERLEHYMERELITEENRKSVELAVMVEVGANVRAMGVMTKELRAGMWLEMGLAELWCVCLGKIAR
jgi:hypothetical protein